MRQLVKHRAGKEKNCYCHDGKVVAPANAVKEIGKDTGNPVREKKEDHKFYKK